MGPQESETGSDKFRLLVKLSSNTPVFGCRMFPIVRVSRHQSFLQLEVPPHELTFSWLAFFFFLLSFFLLISSLFFCEIFCFMIFLLFSLMNVILITMHVCFFPHECLFWLLKKQRKRLPFCLVNFWFQDVNFNANQNLESRIVVSSTNQDYFLFLRRIKIT